KIVNAVMKAYLKEFGNREEERKRTKLEHMRRVHANHLELLKAKTNDLKRFAPEHGPNEKTSEEWHRLRLKRLAAVEEELLQVDGEITRRKAALEGQKDQKEKAPSSLTVPTALVEKELAKDKFVQDYLKETDRLESRRASILKEFKDGPARR